MTVRQLDPGDLEAVIQLVGECPAPPELPETWERMRFIMTEWYLPGRTHKIFGSFEGDRLVATCGMRLDLPIDRAWSLTNLRTLGDGRGLGECMSAALSEAERLELTEYYTCMGKVRVGPFHRLFGRLVPELYNRYEHTVHLEIPANTRPAEDLWWGMMGRRLCDADLVIKRGRLR